jgi:thiol-disulfide isomerase/thioredoxin
MHYKVLTSSDATNLSPRLNKGKWLVLYYANWCGHCQSMKPEWQKTVQNLKNNKNLNIAEVESESVSNIQPKVKIVGFPSLKMYDNGKQIDEFEGQRTADFMQSFALKNCKGKSSKNKKEKQKKTKKRVKKSSK